MSIFVKLILEGHVHNRPEDRTSSYHSWPEGVDLDTVLEIEEKFKKAFVCTKNERHYNHNT